MPHASPHAPPRAPGHGPPALAHPAQRSLLLLLVGMWAMAACAVEHNVPDAPASAVADAGGATGQDTAREIDAASSAADAGAHAEAWTWPPARPGCNGDARLCGRRYSQVVFAATHNAMSSAEDLWRAPNQTHSLRRQLADGIRVFLLDTWERNGELVLCHVYCQLGSRLLAEALTDLRSFLEAHPNEVLTLIFEDHIAPEQTQRALGEAGLEPWIYSHPANAPWPTLSEMLRAHKRLVVFAESATPPPDWLHHLWSHAWDTPYSFASEQEFHCEAHRGQAPPLGAGQLLLVNHWLQDPLSSTALAARANQYDVLMARIEACRRRWGRAPTYLAVDFYEIGDVLEVVDLLNDLRPAR